MQGYRTGAILLINCILDFVHRPIEHLTGSTRKFRDQPVKLCNPNPHISKASASPKAVVRMPLRKMVLPDYLKLAFPQATIHAVLTCGYRLQSVTGIHSQQRLQCMLEADICPLSCSHLQMRRRDSQSLRRSQSVGSNCETIGLNNGSELR